MAALADNANIFVGATLEAFQQMEFLVARDGDVAYAQRLMLEAMRLAITTQGLSQAAKPGSAVGHRAPQ